MSSVQQNTAAPAVTGLSPEHLRPQVNKSAYDIGCHSMRLKGINVSGALVLDLDVAEDESHDPLMAEPEAGNAALMYVTAETPPKTPGASDELFATPQGGNSGGLPEEHIATSESDPAAINAAIEAAGADIIAGTGTLAHAAQKAQMEYAQQARSDAASVLKRRESTAGHGPFENVALEPKEGMHSICILVVGTRGDVQPFLALALGLKEHGHRVRLATHATYRHFVEGQGIEFFPLGGDPAVLSEFVVKNRGILPGGVRDVLDQDEQVSKIVWSCYPACTEADPEHAARPFRATAIIANPPSIAHSVVAEALQVPLHMMFTMPWTPTKLFPHPMCVVQSINVASAVGSMSTEALAGAANYYSYSTIDSYLFLGFTPHLTKLRRHLKLPAWPNPSTAPAHILANLNIPFTYLWSPSLQPKPGDWGGHIGVTGFVFLDEDGTDYTPPDDLAAFLAPPNEPPIYLGFGSLVLSDPKGTTKMIYEAAQKSGKRVLLSSGWAQLGLDVPGKPDSVLLLDDCPHSWLFPRCSAVVHHGGAGTTAAGLRAGLPTLVVPFFGDQPFWGDCCQRAGVGPKPVPIGRLSTKALLHAFETFDVPEVRARARAVSEQMKVEDGRAAAVEHFHHCMKHRSKIIEPGTYGTNPNAIAAMTAFIGEHGKKTYASIQETGQNTLKTITTMPSDIMPTKSQGCARSAAPGAEKLGGADAADVRVPQPRTCCCQLTSTTFFHNVVNTFVVNNHTS